MSSAEYWGRKLKEGCFSHLEALLWSRQGDTAGFQLFSLSSRFACENARIGTSRRFYARIPAQRDCLRWPTAIIYTCIYRQSLIDDLSEIICECATPGWSGDPRIRHLATACQGVSMALCASF